MQIRIKEARRNIELMPPEGESEGFLLRIKNRVALAIGFHTLCEGQRWYGIRIGSLRLRPAPWPLSLFCKNYRPCIRFAYRSLGRAKTTISQGWGIGPIQRGQPLGLDMDGNYHAVEHEFGTLYAISLTDLSRFQTRPTPIQIQWGNNTHIDASGWHWPWRFNDCQGRPL